MVNEFTNPGIYFKPVLYCVEFVYIFSEIDSNVPCNYLGPLLVTGVNSWLNVEQLTDSLK